MVEYNICDTCGACDGRCGLTIDDGEGAGHECLNCHKTRETGDFILHTWLSRTDEEMKKTGQILRSK